MSTLKCAACGQPKKNFSNKCSSCGCDLFIYYCPKCNRQLTTEEKFCPDCGVEEVETSTIATRNTADIPNELKKYENYASLAIVFAFIWPIVGVVFAVIANKHLKGTGSKLAGVASVALGLNIFFLIINVITIILEV